MSESVNDVHGADVLARLRSSGDFLKLMGGAGVGAAVGANVFLREALGAIDKSELEPTNLGFEVGPDLENLTLVGAEADLQQTEGMVIQKFGGEWYVLCSSGRGEIENEDAGPATYRIYLPQSDGAGGLEFFGELRAPYLTNIPHPMVTPLARNRKTKWVMFAFDGTMYYEPILGYGTHGDFYVLDGQPIVRGYEFPPRRP